jgi:UDP-glucose 4-epimerase
VELLEAGFAVVVVDNLVNAKPESLLRYAPGTHMAHMHGRDTCPPAVREEETTTNNNTSTNTNTNNIP